MLERLQKIISRAGVASRRHAETLIVSGQVEVNGRVVTELGAKADPERDAIRVAGRRLRLPAGRVFLALNKPDGCVATLSDPAGRTTLRDFLAGAGRNVFPVAGLEYHATGLVLLTSDGDFAARVVRALGRGLEQTWQIKVKGPLAPAELQAVARSIGPIRPARTAPNPWYEARFAGKHRDRLRHLLLEMGHPVEKLKRVAIGRIELGDLAAGRWRALEGGEIGLIEQDVARWLRQDGEGAAKAASRGDGAARSKGRQRRRDHGRRGP